MSDKQATIDPPAVAKDEVVVQDESIASESATSRLTRLLPPLFTVIASSVIVFFVMRLWRAHLGVPFAYGGDSLPHGMHLQQIIQHGWYWSDVRLGAPFSQHFQDWPLPDLTSLITAWVLALFTNNWAVVMNAMFLLSFPLVALAAWWAARKVGVSPWMASVVGVLYSLLPYHHIRGEQHLFLSNYYVVPFGIVLAMQVISGDSLFGSNRRYRSWLLSFVSWRSVQTLALCAAVGLGGVYYAAFALLFVGAAAAVRVVQSHNLRAVLPGALVAMFIAAFALVATSPALLYHQEHGSNLAAVDRQASDTDVYGLKLAQMLMPSPGHRVDALNELQNRYLGTFPLPGERGSAALGTIAVIGLLYLLVSAGLTLVRRPEEESLLQKRQGQLAFFGLLALLMGTVGGFSTIISLLVSAEIRSWNRISIFIGFLALVFVALLVDAMLARTSRRSIRLVMPVVVVALIGFGTLDQTNGQWIPDYKNVDAAYLSDQRFFEGIEAQLPEDARVFELPMMQFPESPPVANIGSYDLLKPYLHTEDLRWSFAGVKGRLESQWQERLVEVPAAELPKHLFAAGFSGIYVDRDGFADGASELETHLQSVLGAEPVVDSFGKKAFYDLRTYGALLPAGEVAVLHDDLVYPIALVGTKKFFAPESDGTDSWRWADGPRAVLEVDNTTSEPRLSRLSFEVRSATGAPAMFDVAWPDGTTQQVSVAGESQVVAKDLVVAVGDSSITISTTAPRLASSTDSRALHFRVSDVDVSPVVPVP